MMKSRTSFGEWLRQRRKLLDLTQAGLAAQVSVSPVTIRKIEAGDRKPSKELARLLAIALHVPEREHAAFLHFARTDNMTASLPLPAWEPDVPAWRSGQIPTTGPTFQPDTPPQRTLRYDLFPEGGFEYHKTPDGYYIATIQASGPVSGDIEGQIVVQITQLITPKPAGYDYSMALPSPIGAHFTVRTGEEALKGIYTGTLVPLCDPRGNGESRVRATGRIYSATAGLVDCFMNHVFVEDTAKMVEGEGTGATGCMYLKS